MRKLDGVEKFALWLTAGWVSVALVVAADLRRDALCERHPQAWGISYGPVVLQCEAGTSRWPRHRENITSWAPVSWRYQWWQLTGREW